MAPTGSRRQFKPSGLGGCTIGSRAGLKSAALLCPGLLQVAPNWLKVIIKSQRHAINSCGVFFFPARFWKEGIDKNADVEKDLLQFGRAVERLPKCVQLSPHMSCFSTALLQAMQTSQDRDTLALLSSLCVAT